MRIYKPVQHVKLPRPTIIFLIPDCARCRHLLSNPCLVFLFRSLRRRKRKGTQPASSSTEPLQAPPISLYLPGEELLVASSFRSGASFLLSSLLPLLWL